MPSRVKMTKFQKLNSVQIECAAEFLKGLLGNIQKYEI